MMHEKNCEIEMEIKESNPFFLVHSTQNGPEDVKRHRWFREYDWNDVKNRRLNVSY